MRIVVDDSDLQAALQVLQIAVPGAGLAAGLVAVKALADKLRDRLRDMVPDKGGWYDLYRDSIVTVMSGFGQYDVTTTVAEIKYGDILADTSLIWLSGSEGATPTVAKYNPWTLDTIPAVSGGLDADLLVKPASASEVNIFRRKRGDDLADTSDMGIKKQVYTRHNESILPESTLPTIRGKVVADVPFLAKRLEYGLGGFPRTPIWTRAAAEGKVLSGHKDIKDAAGNVFASRWHPE
jgi:hypothetical protein